MSPEEDIDEGTRVKIDHATAADDWIVTAVSGEGDEERFYLVHADYPDMTRAVCRDRIRLPETTRRR